MVEEQYIIPVVGEKLYTDLDTAYIAAADENVLDATQKALLEKIRNVIGPLVCYFYTPKAEVQLSDAGAQRAETATNKTAYQNQVAAYREQNLRESETSTEQLLQFLEKKQSDYPDWLTSEAFKNHRSLFIKSGTEFNSLFPSHSPCRNYMAMRASMADVEVNIIRRALGNELYTNIKETDQAADGVFSAPEKELIHAIKKAVAYITVATAVPFLNVRIDTNGITVQSAGTRAQDDKVAARSAALDSALNNLIIAAREAGQAWINNISDWIKENTTPEAVAIPNQIHDTGNTERAGSFGMF